MQNKITRSIKEEPKSFKPNKISKRKKNGKYTSIVIIKTIVNQGHLRLQKKLFTEQTNCEEATKPTEHKSTNYDLTDQIFQEKIQFQPKI